jgi:site-specific recombinase XerD
MNYLSSSKIEPEDIKVKTVIDYLVSVKEKAEWTEATKNTNLYELRKFLTYLIDKHGVSYDSVSPLHVIFGCHKVHLPAYYEPVEVMKLINSIDVSSRKGKRDYLICLLVTQLGMRAGDVSRLKFSNIHWDRETIEIVQQKTGNPLVLPLIMTLRFALLDYWKNARQKCNSDIILLTRSKPHRSLSNCFLAGIVTERLKKANIDISNRKHGCHSMRHSLARNLLSGNEALSTITGILGHESSNTTRKYLGIDTRELRRISLEVPNGRK